jgi:hypothetical protein
MVTRHQELTLSQTRDVHERFASGHTSTPPSGSGEWLLRSGDVVRGSSCEGEEASRLDLYWVKGWLGVGTWMPPREKGDPICSNLQYNYYSLQFNYFCTQKRLTLVEKEIKKEREDNIFLKWRIILDKKKNVEVEKKIKKVTTNDMVAQWNNDGQGCSCGIPTLEVERFALWHPHVVASSIS